jgi:hypothetical protein
MSMLTWENNPIQGAKDITEKLVVSTLDGGYVYREIMVAHKAGEGSW